MKKKKLLPSDAPKFWESLKMYLPEIIIAFLIIYFFYWLTLLIIENS